LPFVGGAFSGRPKEMVKGMEQQVTGWGSMQAPAVFAPSWWAPDVGSGKGARTESKETLDRTRDHEQSRDKMRRE